jgi:hypothetical protein
MIFPMFKFLFVSSNIPVSPAYGVYISQLIRYYSRACAKYSDFLDITQLLTQELLKQDYVTLRLKSSLQNFYDRYHDLVDPYEISISQMTMNRFLFTYMFYFFYYVQYFYRTWQDIWVTRGCLIRSRNCLPFVSIRVHPRYYDGVHVDHRFSFLLCAMTYLYVLSSVLRRTLLFPQ